MSFSRYADDITLMAESEEKLKSLLMKLREESGFKLAWSSSFKTTNTMTFDPITSWQIEGGKVETVTDFIFLSSKITADGDCSHEIKR